jgi:hypothetical protein
VLSGLIRPSEGSVLLDGRPVLGPPADVALVFQDYNITALAIQPTALAFYAKERGFFSRQGIDAKITVINDPQQAPAAVLSGTAAFSSFSVSGLAVLKSRGAPVRLVAAGALYAPKAPTTALVSAKGSGSRAPATSLERRSPSTRRTRPPTSGCCDGSSETGSTPVTFTSSRWGRSHRCSAR